MLNELEKDTLQILLNNILLLKTVEKVFNETINTIKPNIIAGENNEIVGQKYRAYDTAQELINQSFRNLLMYKIETKIIKEDINKGR